MEPCRTLDKASRANGTGLRAGLVGSFRASVWLEGRGRRVGIDEKITELL